MLCFVTILIYDIIAILFQVETDDETDGAVQSDLIVLDPDHPLMRRFQLALNAQLPKQLEKAKLNHKEQVIMASSHE